MSENEFPTTEEAACAEGAAVSEPLPNLGCLEFDVYRVKVETDNVYRVEVWHIGDSLPLYTKPGLQTIDAAMLDGLAWLIERENACVTAIQAEIDKRTP